MCQCLNKAALSFMSLAGNCLRAKRNIYQRDIMAHRRGYPKRFCVIMSLVQGGCYVKVLLSVCPVVRSRSTRRLLRLFFGGDHSVV